MSSQVRISCCSLTFRLSLLLICLHVTTAKGFSLVDCKQANAEHGSKLCKEAFSHTYSEHKMKFVTSPIKTPCCLTLSLRNCVEHAFIKARCDPKDQKIAIMIRDQISDAQRYIKEAADKLTSALCGDYKRGDCGDRFLLHFDQAIHQINVLNGSGSLKASAVATLLAALTGTLYFNRRV